MYMRGNYDQSTKKYNIIPCTDAWGAGRMVKGTTPIVTTATY